MTLLPWWATSWRCLPEVCCCVKGTGRWINAMAASLYARLGRR
ncbi:hypothetical protein EVA_18635 [gut metagenome]|uniref:Uncharacterized protein n=1 Tax=gut metagenome TaxID=749906 RepID=J9G106_9ZZZZ